MNKFIGEMNVFIGNVKGEDLTRVAAATQGEEARGVPELSEFGGGARISGHRRRDCSGVVRWRRSLRGGVERGGQCERGM